MIRNKVESDLEIKKRGLNRMHEEMFTREDTELLKVFLRQHNFSYYNIRDKSDCMGKFLYKITAEDVLLNSKNYDIFSVYESLAAADEKLILQGELMIDVDFVLSACLSDVKRISNRDAMKNPVYIINVDLKEKREPDIAGLRQVIDYVVEHELIGMIVEFSLFGIDVGINKEKILIWELRNY